MKIAGVDFCITDWSLVDPSEHPGTSGTAYWRTLEAGKVLGRAVLVP